MHHHFLPLYKIEGKISQTQSSSNGGVCSLPAEGEQDAVASVLGSTVVRLYLQSRILALNTQYEFSITRGLNDMLSSEDIQYFNNIAV